MLSLSGLSSSTLPLLGTHIVRLEGVQRAAVRFCTNDYDWSSSVTSMLEKLKACTLEKGGKALA